MLQEEEKTRSVTACALVIRWSEIDERHPGNSEERRGRTKKKQQSSIGCIAAKGREGEGR